MGCGFYTHAVTLEIVLITIWLGDDALLTEISSPCILDTDNRQSQLPVISEQKKDSEWQSLMEQRNKLARERTALQNGIRLKNAEIDDVHAKLLSLG